MGAKKKESAYTVRFMANTSIVGTVNGKELSITSWPVSGNNQVQIVFKKTITLNANDTIGIKLIKTQGKKSGFYSCFFWAKPTGGSYSSQYLFNNTSGSDAFNGTIKTFTATQTISGTVVGIKTGALDQTYNPALKFSIEMYINGVKVP